MSLSVSVFAPVFVPRAQAQTTLTLTDSTDPLSLTVDTSRYPTIQVAITAPCSRISNPADPASLQIEEDGVTVRPEELIERIEQMRTATAMLWDVWKQVQPQVQQIQSNVTSLIFPEDSITDPSANLTESLTQNLTQNRLPSLSSDLDLLAVYAPNTQGITLTTLMAWTVDGGGLVNATQEYQATAPADTALLSLLRQTLQVFAQTQFEQLPGQDAELKNTQRRILIFSNGYDHLLSNGYISQGTAQLNLLIQEANEQQVAIHSVFFPYSQKFDNPTLLKTISEGTGGQLFTLTGSESFIQLWAEPSTTPHCQFSYRSSSPQPRQLTVRGGLLVGEDGPLRFNFPLFKAKPPRITLGSLPQEALVIGQNTMLAITFDSVFADFTERRIQRVEYQIEDQSDGTVKRRYEQSQPPFGSFELPIAALPAGDYNLIIHLWDDVGQQGEARRPFRLREPPLPTATPTSTRTPVPTATATPSLLVSVKGVGSSTLSFFQVAQREIKKEIDTRQAQQRWWLAAALAVLTLLAALLLYSGWQQRKRQKREHLRIALTTGSIQSVAADAKAVLRRISTQTDLQEVILLERLPITLGRNRKGLDIALNSSDLGDNVFSIREQRGQFYISPESDSKGVSIEDSSLGGAQELSLEAKQEYVLKPESKIKVGKVQFQFYILSDTQLQNIRNNNG